MRAPSPQPGGDARGRRQWTLVHGGDDSLPALLADVLSEMSLEPSPRGADAAHLILVHVEGPSGLAKLEAAARRHAGRAAIVALLPFADDRMKRDALRRGATGVFALGTPMTQLKDLVAAALNGGGG